MHQAVLLSARNQFGYVGLYDTNLSIPSHCCHLLLLFVTTCYYTPPIPHDRIASIILMYV